MPRFMDFHEELKLPAEAASHENRYRCGRRIVRACGCTR
jgi:hypothetical protein